MNLHSPNSSSTTPHQVAILGASGIGKNHAAWFAKHGCHIAAFAGSSAATVEATQKVIESRLGYVPRGYTSVSHLLQNEKLDAVCVSTPPQLHFEQVQQCLQSGIHTLCEKPLVYNPQLDSKLLISQAQQLVELAASRQVLLGTQMQYPFIAEKLCEMAQVMPKEVETFKVEMETKNLKPGRSHETVWVEMAPHPISVLQRISQNTRLDETSIRCTISELETDATFVLERNDGPPVRAQIITRCNPTATTPLRRFTLNGNAIDYAGRKNENGDFLTYLSPESSGTEIEMPDLVDLLIGNFVAACQQKEPLQITGADGARNVEWMLKILDRGDRV